MHQNFRNIVRFGVNRHQFFVWRALLCRGVRCKQKHRQGGERDEAMQRFHQKILGGRSLRVNDLRTTISAGRVSQEFGDIAANDCMIARPRLRRLVRARLSCK